MQLEQLQVELRPRPQWEAAELGQALVRRHAAAIWWPWLWCSLPVFLLCNLLGWVLGQLWLAALLLWWLKPVFDRIPLFVLSRAVFGPAPTLRQTLMAQLRWGWAPMLGYLTWRRLGPVRALYLPIDLLEGGPYPAQRRAVVGSGMRGTALLLTLVCAHFEVVLVLSAYALGMLFVPVEWMSETLRAAWALLSVHPPLWVQVLGNALLWLASSVMEPFYVGAGFGLYLDRRTRIEAWDVEIGFRRLRARALRSLGTLACVCLLGLGMGLGVGLPAQAQTHAPASPGKPVTGNPCEGSGPASTKKTDKPLPDCLPDIFGKVVDDPKLDAAVQRAWQDPLLSPSRKVMRWVPKQAQQAPKPRKPRPFDNPILNAVATLLGWMGEYGLWGLAVLLVLLLVRTRAHWLPWLRRLQPTPVVAQAPPQVQPHLDDDALPAALAQHLRALWAQGRQRRALALLYRASVEAMVARTGAVLLPGATEAECLRSARALRDEADRNAFTGMVRAWQYAAYAGQLPSGEEFEALLHGLSLRFGWPA